MKGVILAGGSGTRLLPLTKIFNKNLLPIYDKPMIYYPIKTLRNAGIEDILIVSGKGHAGQFLDLLGSGKELGAKFAYEVQEEPGGIAQALGLAESFADEESIAMILGDNIFQDQKILSKGIREFQKQNNGAKIFLKSVPDPQRFGIAELKKDKVVKIVEKPKKPKTSLAVTGLYLYDNRVFNVIKKLKPSKRGELEITDVNNKYIKWGNMGYEIIKGKWIDAGTFPSLLEASIFASKISGGK